MPSGPGGPAGNPGDASRHPPRTKPARRGGEGNAWPTRSPVPSGGPPTCGWRGRDPGFPPGPPPSPRTGACRARPGPGPGTCTGATAAVQSCTRTATRRAFHESGISPGTGGRPSPPAGSGHAGSGCRAEPCQPGISPGSAVPSLRLRPVRPRKAGACHPFGGAAGAATRRKTAAGGQSGSGASCPALHRRNGRSARDPRSPSGPVVPHETPVRSRPRQQKGCPRKQLPRPGQSRRSRLAFPSARFAVPFVS